MVLGNHLLLSSHFRFPKDHPSGGGRVMFFNMFILFGGFLAELMIFNQISRPLIIISFRIMNYVQLMVLSCLSVIVD